MEAVKYATDESKPEKSGWTPDGDFVVILDSPKKARQPESTVACPKESK